MPTNTMKHIAAALVKLAFSTTSWAGFVEGVAAYNRGDFAAALQEWRPLAEQGIASAQFNLGIMYANGKGVAIDDVEAVKWYRRAADQENDSDVLVHLSFGDFLILLPIFLVLLVVVNMRKEEAQKKEEAQRERNSREEDERYERALKARQARERKEQEQDMSACAPLRSISTPVPTRPAP